MQRFSFLILLLPLALAGCLSFSSSDPKPPEHTTVVVPQTSAPPNGAACSAPC